MNLWKKYGVKNVRNFPGGLEISILLGKNLLSGLNSLQVEKILLAKVCKCNKPWLLCTVIKFHVVKEAKEAVLYFV